VAGTGQTGKVLNVKRNSQALEKQTRDGPTRLVANQDP
jgi:hypothetical protein